tara:strand:- start:263 stop:1489 length:1227 start_codon:yes stop_codon:yes gene_type:complete
MKIIYLYQYFITPKGAGATRAYEMAKRLVQAGHEVHMVTSDAGWMGQSKDNDATDWFETNEDGIHVHWLPVPYSNYMGFFARVKAFLKFMMAARKKAAALGGDVVYATSSPLTIAIPGVYASKKNKVPLVFEVRDLWPEAPIQMGALKNPILRFIAKRLELYAYRNASHVVGLSPGMRDGILATGKPDAQVSVIPNSSDLELFSQVGEVSEVAKESLNVGGKFVLSYCGTMGEANGLNFVLDCAVELKTRGQDQIQFLLIGEGKERPALEARLKREELDNVTFSEPLPKSEITRVFEASDVCMTIFKNVPILRTCSPNKLFDSLAAGRPVLTNMPGWLGDIAVDDRTGVLVQPDDPMDFADKVIGMFESPGELIEFSKNSRALAKSRFDRDLLAKKLEQVLTSAVSEY